MSAIVCYFPVLSIPEEVVTGEPREKSRGGIIKDCNRYPEYIYYKSVVNVGEMGLSGPKPTLYNTIGSF